MSSYRGCIYVSEITVHEKNIADPGKRHRTEEENIMEQKQHYCRFFSLLSCN